ncbi:hypothetical protein T12_9013 [Trichinella patagoniensis]|uniref:Uncharacterized protein n=1 Tax=Trichinella patagoniensis TaxID=990121 RepID=A0A0V1A7C8_9BILA|nr:hypothetical protein T12_9013 [Trichinella patagoniensis]
MFTPDHDACHCVISKTFEDNKMMLSYAEQKTKKKQLQNSGKSMLWALLNHRRVKKPQAPTPRLHES